MSNDHVTLNNLIPLSLWPQTRVLIDFYKPANAAPLLRALRNLDDDAARVSIKRWATDAERESTRKEARA